MDDDFTVIKFSGLNEIELWRQMINGTATNSLDQALAITVDRAGDVIVAGIIENSGTDVTFTVVKFSGIHGTELWRRLISSGTANAVGVDQAGDVVAAGVIANDFAVIKFSGVKILRARSLTCWHILVSAAIAVPTGS